MVEWVSWVGLVLSNSGSEMMVGRLVNQRDTISHTVADCLCHVQHLQSRADNKYGLLDWSLYWSLFSSKQTTRGKTNKTRFDMRYMG